MLSAKSVGASSQPSRSAIAAPTSGVIRPERDVAVEQAVRPVLVACRVDGRRYAASPSPSARRGTWTTDETGSVIGASDGNERTVHGTRPRDPGTCVTLHPMRRFRLHLGSWLSRRQCWVALRRPRRPHRSRRHREPADVRPVAGRRVVAADGVAGGDGGNGGQVVAVAAGLAGVRGRRHGGMTAQPVTGRSGSRRTASWSSVGAPGQLDSRRAARRGRRGRRVRRTGGRAGSAPSTGRSGVPRSPDGGSWARPAQVPGSADTYPEWLASGDDGVLAAGTDADGAPAVWRSPDGRCLRARDLDVPADLAVSGSAGGGRGFVALGRVGQPTVLLARPMARPGRPRRSMPGPDRAPPTRLVAGRWGYVVQGDSPGLRLLPRVPAGRSAWWSGDGRSWGRFPPAGTPAATGGSLVVSAGSTGCSPSMAPVPGRAPTAGAGRRCRSPGDGSVPVNAAVVERRHHRRGRGGVRRGRHQRGRIAIAE